jgi:hypothetical protein
MAELRLEGRLEESNLAKLMYSICRTGETGTLYLMHGPVTASIYINKGNVVFASSNDPDHRLGELLIRHGQIQYSQYVAASTQLHGGKRLGGVLVEMGYLTAQDLFHYVIEQVKEIIFTLFTWTEGQYRFEIGALPSKEVITLNISTADLVMEGVKQISSWTRVREAVGNLDSIYELAPDFERRLEGLTLTEGERRILDSVREFRVLDRILENTKFPDFETCRMLWAFSIIGLINHRDAMEDEVGSLLGEALGSEPAAPAPSAAAARHKPSAPAAAKAPPAPAPPPAKAAAPAPPAPRAEETEEFAVELVDEPSAPAAPSVTKVVVPASTMGGVSFDLDEAEESAAPAAPAPAAGIPVKELDDAVRRFNEKQAYLFGLLKAEIEAEKAASFVQDAMDKMERRHMRIFDGAKAGPEGAFPAETLVRNIRGNSIAQYQEGLDALLDAEMEAAKAVFKNPARMMVVRKGLKRFDEKGE